jgi:hypothetical protein
MGIFAEILMVYVAVAVSLGSISALKALALTTIDEFTSIGLEYTTEVAIGSDPSVVYLIIAPSVEQVIVTV